MKQTMPSPGPLDDPPLGHAEEAHVEIVETLALAGERSYLR